MTVFALQEGPRAQRIDIGDGLIMRWSTKADADDVGTLLSEAFRWEPLGPPVPVGTVPGPNETVASSGRRLLSGNSAVMTEYDYALVENTRAKPGECPLVACACLHAVPGYYGSVQLQYGKPEVIATHPDYRSKGLARRLMLEMIHPASDERGDLIQFLYGIPHFYLYSTHALPCPRVCHFASAFCLLALLLFHNLFERSQFGYTYALRTGERRNKMPSLDVIPKLESGKSEPFVLRTVTLADIPYLVKMSTRDRLHRDDTQLGLLFDEAYWKFTTHDIYQSIESVYDVSRQTQIIVDVKTGKDVGVTVSSFTGLWQWDLFTLEEDSVSFLDTIFPVLRGMIMAAKDQYDDPTSTSDDNSYINHMINGLGSHHPASQILEPLMQPDISDRIYTRIPSYARFLTKVAPVLEERLAKSAMMGITGSLYLDFYRKVEGSSGRGLELRLEGGKVAFTKDWIPPMPQERMLEARKRIDEGKPAEKEEKEYGASFAPLSFTRLVTGEIDVDQMLEQYGENWVRDPASKLLLGILFPKVQHHFVSLWW